ncbi:tetratricopeptide repeat protein 12-like isoform X1 [Daktulosphaira vitifoliae]|uniref:tetratricopeptide repeat protein 12-like isoform X1 n=1 Tax=Daktulosphaira vitifoliae TaxID=58002 RepID=UPI0021AABE01|nr:tetratricopeptide repeat protein 12-like isoform X1 [Daktulosphaira vitifoliae]XP_050536311.1 tetratricopeptide repeat protein 12-like isoform X1 [Daktulosphaira vitifoliae]XP_050536312.1 tetratricopeptide repeat protein 12-like isoform X1 [Daktulosphaira vitifoliae]
MEDEDFDESMRKVNLIGGIVKDIASKDDCKSRLGMIRAEELLGNYDKTWDESSLKTVQNGTKINLKAFEDLNTHNEKVPTDAAGFMAYVERDAKQRADAKKKEIKQSDYFKTMGNHEYRNKNFEKALIYYNQAIDVRKDSCVLYTNRALTKINLGLLDEAVADCDKALRINERSLNALLYKAEALNGLGDMAVAKQVLADALNTYPDKTQRIQDYRKKLNL